ncbi:hypothetical protein MKW98_030583, partial [Papaver atlanticum]
CEVHHIFSQSRTLHVLSQFHWPHAPICHSVHNRRRRPEMLVYTSAACLDFRDESPSFITSCMRVAVSSTSVKEYQGGLSGWRILKVTFTSNSLANEFWENSSTSNPSRDGSELHQPICGLGHLDPAY